MYVTQRNRPNKASVISQQNPPSRIKWADNWSKNIYFLVSVVLDRASGCRLLCRFILLVPCELYKSWTWEMSIPLWWRQYSPRGWPKRLGADQGRSCLSCYAEDIKARFKRRLNLNENPVSSRGGTRWQRDKTEGLVYREKAMWGLCMFFRMRISGKSGCLCQY